MSQPTEYLVSPAQVRRLRRWLEAWTECPWCERTQRRYDFEAKPHTVTKVYDHTPRCLLALIAGRSRRGA